MRALAVARGTVDTELQEEVRENMWQSLDRGLGNGGVVDLRKLG